MDGRARLDRATSEDNLQATVLQMAGLGGWLAYHTYDSRRSEEGFPDLVLARPPELLVVELKRQGENPTPDQQVWLDTLVRCGVEAVVWRPSDLDDIEARLLARPTRRTGEWMLCPRCSGAGKVPSATDVVACRPCKGQGVAPS